MCVLGGRAAVLLTLPARRGKIILEVTGRLAPHCLTGTNHRLMSCAAQFSREGSQGTGFAQSVISSVFVCVLECVSTTCIFIKPVPLCVSLFSEF